MLASLLATVRARVVFGVGGVWGILALSGLVATLCSALVAIGAFG